MQRVADVPAPPTRPTDAHKGDAGRVLVVAGSRGMAGAAALAGNAALRAGAGLVEIVTPDDCLDTVAALAPCCTTAPLQDVRRVWLQRTAGKRIAGQILALAEGRDALVMGPGMGRSQTVWRVVRGVLAEVRVPVVLDADGLNVIADDPRAVLCAAKVPVILTPHPGEAARLLGRTAGEVQADREASASRLARLAPVAVLKGAGTIVCDGRRLYVNRTGNPGMATAGAGDVLAGLVGAFLAARMDPFDAAVLAVWAHGRAGDLAAREQGVLGTTAWDILGCVPLALRI